MNARTKKGMVLLAAASIIIAACLHGREPRYQGKTLYAWSSGLEEVSLRLSDEDGIQIDKTNLAVAAIISAGTNNVPWLRSELKARDSRLQRLRYWVYRLPPAVQMCADKIPFVRPGPTETERRLNAGMAALVLGETAKEVAPELSNLLNSEKTESLYAFALARMGTNGLPSLMQGLSYDQARFATLCAMGSISFFKQLLSAVTAKQGP